MADFCQYVKALDANLHGVGLSGLGQGQKRAFLAEIGLRLCFWKNVSFSGGRKVKKVRRRVSWGLGQGVWKISWRFWPQAWIWKKTTLDLSRSDAFSRPDEINLVRRRQNRGPGPHPLAISAPWCRNLQYNKIVLLVLRRVRDATGQKIDQRSIF